MAVTNQNSAQYDADRLYPVEYGGKVRISYFEFTQITAAGDALSTAELCRLPMGRIRILPQNSRIAWSAFGASRVLDVGFRAYVTEGNAAVAEVANQLVNDIDVSSAGAGVAIGTLLKFDIFSTKGVVVFAQVAGGTIPLAATLKGYIAYVAE